MWVDLNDPTPDEGRMLTDVFHFHDLAVEDALSALGSRIQRAKSRGSTSPYVNVIPLITMFRRRTRLSAR